MGKAAKFIKSAVKTVVNVVKKVVKIVVNVVKKVFKAIMSNTFLRTVLIAVVSVFTFGMAGIFVAVAASYLTTTMAQKRAEKQLEQQQREAELSISEQEAAAKKDVDDHFTKLKTDLQNGGISTIGDSGYSNRPPNTKNNEKSNTGATLAILAGVGLAGLLIFGGSNGKDFHIDQETIN